METLKAGQPSLPMVSLPIPNSKLKELIELGQALVNGIEPGGFAAGGREAVVFEDDVSA
nr:hypothetical protein [Cytobacillus firmus]